NTLAVDMVIYRLYSRRFKLTPPDVVKARHGEAMQILEQVRTGKISFGMENTGGAETPDAGGPVVNAPDRVFTRDSLEDY
ncbi:MAG: DUF1320 family protein, partial [Desulfocapsaceae bacterium]|nr:DUF1320 family protein [Desulfocapsaceae bacterium]